MKNKDVVIGRGIGNSGLNKSIVHVNYEEKTGIIIKTKIENGEFKFKLDLFDTMFMLNPNDGLCRESFNPIVGKMVGIKEVRNIDIVQVSKYLFNLLICKLNIISIDNNSKFGEINISYTTKYSEVFYVEMKEETFLKILSLKGLDFIEYNKNNIYILRNGGYKEIKTLFNKVKGNVINFEVERPNKAHLLSHLDFNLSCYLMAMFNCDINLVNYLNAFDIMDY